MRIEQLHLKPARNAPMVQVGCVTAIAGLGLANDCHASPSSPRQILIVSTAALTELQVKASDLGANVVVDENIDAFPSGTILRMGEVRVRLTISCESCSKLDAIRNGLARDTRGRRGMLGRIITGGETRVGDHVTVESGTLPKLEDAWQARVIDILRELPADKQLTFARLAEIAGVQPTYCRAFPSLLRRLAGSGLPVERVVTASSRSSERSETRLWDGVSYFLHTDSSE